MDFSVGPYRYLRNENVEIAVIVAFLFSGSGDQCVGFKTFNVEKKQKKECFHGCYSII